MKRILSIILLISCIFSILIVPVYAEEFNYGKISNVTFDLVKLVEVEKESVNGYTYKYYAPELYQEAFIFQGNNIINLIYMKSADEMSIGTNGKIYLDGASKQFYLIQYPTIEEAEDVLFGRVEVESVNVTLYTNLYVYQNILYTKEFTGGYTGTGGDTTIVSQTMDDYYEQTIKETIEDSGGGGGASFDKEYQDGVLGWLQRLWDGILAIPSKIQDGIDAMVGWFETAVISIQAIPDRIADFFKGTITDEEGDEITITEHILESVNEDLDKQLFFSTVFDFGNRFKEFLKHDFSEVPSTDLLTIDLDAEESELVDLGRGEISAIDVSWYSRYKPFADAIMSCFLWMGFMFLLWRNLPQIVQGYGAGVSSAYTGVTKFDEAHSEKINKSTTRSITVDTNTGEVKRDYTTYKTTERGKK